jgi:putative multicomponent Na+:H+ antiporter subunit B
MDNFYIYAIVALLPIAASMLVLQTNPYHALVIRGVLGAVSALVYAVLGAPDVALTEALVGTLLAVTLYAVAVRSSLVLRLGILKTDLKSLESNTSPLQPILDKLRKLIQPYYLRIELVPYATPADLQQALATQEIHALCDQHNSFEIKTRLHRIHEILDAGGLATTVTTCSLIQEARQ